MLIVYLTSLSVENDMVLMLNRLSCVICSVNSARLLAPSFAYSSQSRNAYPHSARLGSWELALEKLDAGNPVPYTLVGRTQGKELDPLEIQIE